MAIAACLVYMSDVCELSLYLNNWVYRQQANNKKRIVFFWFFIFFCGGKRRTSIQPNCEINSNFSLFFFYFHQVFWYSRISHTPNKSFFPFLYMYIYHCSFLFFFFYGCLRRRDGGDKRIQLCSGCNNHSPRLSVRTDVRVRINCTQKNRLNESNNKKKKRKKKRTH